jgi:hypothetical protein
VTPARRFYFDTSAQFERIGGTTEAREQLEKLVKRGDHSTSTQVLREWNRIVLGTCVKLMNVLPRCRDRNDVVNRMRANAFGPRAIGRRWQVTEWIMSNEADLRLVEMRAKNYQRIRARVEFMAGVNTLRDGTDCEVARRKPYRHKNNWKYDEQCKKTEDICVQPDFLAQKRDRAMAAAIALEASDRSDDREMGKKARKAIEDSNPRATKGKACHAAKGIGGDICIALECAEDEVLLTTDKSFELICPALELEFERL